MKKTIDFADGLTVRRVADERILRGFRDGKTATEMRSEGHAESAIDNAREVVLWGRMLPCPTFSGFGPHSLMRRIHR